MTRRGLKTRKGLPVSSQAFSTMLQNKLYVGIVDAPGYGVVGKRGDFDPLIPDDVFYRVQASWRDECTQPGLTSAVGLSSPYAHSSSALRADGVSPQAGRRAAAPVTRTTTACHLAGR